MDTKTITAKFTSFPFDSNWVNGIVGDYLFEAKLFDDRSTYGINNGRVSKLCVYSMDRKGIMDWDKTFINYDRGWDIRPAKEYKATFKAVMELLESAPRRFDLMESHN